MNLQRRFEGMGARKPNILAGSGWVVAGLVRQHDVMARGR
jgi:hypothetical protein